MKNNNLPEIDHHISSITSGLSSLEVQQRKQQGMVNKCKRAVGKSYFEIIRTNVLSFFNILLFIIAGLMIYGEYYDGLFFLFVLIPNIFIGLFEDIKAKILLSRMRLITQPEVAAIRNSNIETIKTEDVVIDDILLLSAGNQICADGIVQAGGLFVNESFLTGESKTVEKKVGDRVYSGSFVTSGKGYVYVDKIGNECFANQIQSKANKFKRSPSEILKSLKRLFIVIGSIVILMAAFTITVYSIQGRFDSAESFKESIPSISGSMVGMIPSGLYLLTSAALAVGVARLSKKHAQVQDFYSVEMLARTNVLCVDKTGTITDGTMKVKNVDVIDIKYTPDEIGQIVSNVVKSTQDNNFTAKALNEFFTYELTSKAKEILPFCSENKYSAATFGGNKTYVLGAIEFLNIENGNGLFARANDYEEKGYRVLAVCEARNQITKSYIEGPMHVIGLIIMEDHIKEDVNATFQWFADNGVAIKVISGDNAVTVSRIASKAGIQDAGNYISLEGKTDEEVREAAIRYTVFGRVTPEQKEIIVTSLKEHDNTVAMTGDGVNDILALKRADCSIAMASGADSARDVSHIVLLDSNFGSLPSVVKEGRRVINNLQRTCSLFLVKTIFTMVVTLTFLLLSLILKDPTINYPFVTNNLYLWEIVCVGLPSFAIALQKNGEQIKGKFLSNILKKAIPAGITMILAVSAIFILYAIDAKNIFFFDIESFEAASSMAVVVFTLLSLIVLYKICSPFDLFRGIVMTLSCVVTLGALTLSYFNLDSDLLKINFELFVGENYLAIGVVTFLALGLYLTISKIVEIIKGEDLDEN